jgi:hypothetical protein
MSNEHVHLNAPSNGGVKGPLDVIAIEAEDDQLDALLGFLDRRDQRRASVPRLNQELHAGQLGLLISLKYCRPPPILASALY